MQYSKTAWHTSEDLEVINDYFMIISIPEQFKCHQRRG